MPVEIYIADARIPGRTVYAVHDAHLVYHGGTRVSHRGNFEFANGAICPDAKLKAWLDQAPENQGELEAAWRAFTRHAMRPVIIW